MLLGGSRLGGCACLCDVRLFGEGADWGSPGSVDIGLSGFCRGDVLRFEL